MICFDEMPRSRFMLMAPALRHDAEGDTENGVGGGKDDGGLFARRHPCWRHPAAQVHL